jgi:hypothetical protein
MTGTLYGALLHALTSEGNRPLRRLVRGNGDSGYGFREARAAGAQRFGAHLLYGAATALAFELLAEWRKRRMGQDA